MLDIALNQHRGPVKRKGVTERQSIPDAYLVLLISLFRNHGLIKTIRGPAGGLLLTKKASEVTLADIYTCLEGQDSYRNPVSHATTVLEEDTDAHIIEIWNEMQSRIRDYLGSITLEELCEKLKKKEDVIIYHI